jgi:hypothetical protein
MRAAWILLAQDGRGDRLARRAADCPGEPYRLIGADGREHQSRTPGPLVAHRRNKIYGRLDCPGAARWITRGHYARQRVCFADEGTAIAAGYRPCPRCLPESYACLRLTEGSSPA